MAPMFLNSNTRLLLIPLWNIKIYLELFFYSSTNFKLNVIRVNMAYRNHCKLLQLIFVFIWVGPR